MRPPLLKALALQIVRNFLMGFNQGTGEGVQQFRDLMRGFASEALEKLINASEQTTVLRKAGHLELVHTGSCRCGQLNHLRPVLGQRRKHARARRGVE